MAQLLSEAEIQERAKQLEGWTVEVKKLRITRKFEDFLEAEAKLSC